MLTRLLRSLLLHLSRQVWLKDWLADLPGFRQVTRRFIAGETIAEAVSAIRALNQLGIRATLDHLGESTTSPPQAVADAEEYLRVLQAIEESSIDSNISIKLTQLGLDIDESFCLENTRRLVAEAHRRNIFVRIDMEDSSKTEATLRIFTTLFREFGNVGIVLQSALYRTEQDLAAVVALGARVRLCKGAYHEPETVAFPEKADVDRHYLDLMRKLLDSGVYHALATHDEALIVATRQAAAERGLSPDRYEFQMLYGVRRDLQQQLVGEGYRVRVYVPYGRFWYPYFMRRLAERPANLWFILRQLFRP
jgi:proline dehydrogenase